MSAELACQGHYQTIQNVYDLLLGIVGSEASFSSCR